MMRLMTLGLLVLATISCKMGEKSMSATSEIICPYCNYQTIEKLPTAYCVIAYDCKSCGKTINPKEEDCCVYCSYGSHKCPSKQ